MILEARLPRDVLGIPAPHWRIRLDFCEHKSASYFAPEIRQTYEDTSFCTSSALRFQSL